MAESKVELHPLQRVRKHLYALVDEIVDDPILQKAWDSNLEPGDPKKEVVEIRLMTDLTDSESYVEQYETECVVSEQVIAEEPKTSFIRDALRLL